MVNLALTTHCGALPLKSGTKNIQLSFVYYFLKENLKQYAREEQNKKVTVNIIKDIEIQIPINQHGDFDLKAQREIVEKYKKVKDIKTAIIQELDKIFATEIDL